MRRVLVVEDEPSVADLLASELRSLVDQVDQANDGRNAVSRAQSTDYALITLDLMLPGLGGRRLCELIRAARPASSILAITARADMVASLIGMRNGCDDYVLKPFSLSDLRARAERLLERPRRVTTRSPEAGWTIGEVCLEPAKGVLSIAGRPVDGISHSEFEVVNFLARAAGVSFSRQELLAAVWGIHHSINFRTLHVDFQKLREKLRHPTTSAPYLSVGADERYLFNDPQGASTDIRHGEHESLHHHP